MWNELESYKNHFLQWRYPSFKSEVLNQMVSKEFKSVQKKRDTCCFPDNVECKHSTYFDDHAKLAYGFWALPQLIKESCSDTLFTQWQAINSLSELLMNPIEAQRAINEEDIVRIMRNIFLRKRRYRNLAKYREVEMLMQIFYILSIYLNGAQHISMKKNLLIDFYIMIYNKEKYIEIASKVLRNLSEKSKVLLHLLDHTDSLNYLTTIFYKDQCAPYYPEALWYHLGHFLEIAPEHGIELGFFDLLHGRIAGQVPDYHRQNMKCFALLLQCEMGQRRFDACDGVKLLYRVFTEDAPLDTYEFVVQAFQNAIISKRALWRCREHLDIGNILVQLATQRPSPCQADKKQMGDVVKENNANEEQECCEGGAVSRAGENIQEVNNPRLQLYCLQALRQMCQMPCIRRYIREVCLPDIRKIECLNELNECTRDDLVHCLVRKAAQTD